MLSAGQKMKFPILKKIDSLAALLGIKNRFFKKKWINKLKLGL